MQAFSSGPDIRRSTVEWQPVLRDGTPRETREAPKPRKRSPRALSDEMPCSLSARRRRGMHGPWVAPSQCPPSGVLDRHYLSRLLDLGLVKHGQLPAASFDVPRRRLRSGCRSTSSCAPPSPWRPIGARLHFQVPHGRSAKVMGHTTNHAGLPAGREPRGGRARLRGGRSISC